MSILNQLIGHEITVTNSRVFLDKYKYGERFELHYNEILKLINNDFLEQESGNFDTGERHYIVNTLKLSQFNLSTLPVADSHWRHTPNLISAFRDFKISLIHD